MKSETGFDPALYDRFPAEPRPQSELDDLKRAWEAPKGWAILPNNQGTLAGWISNSQNLKPGNRMPDYHVLSGPDLRAVAAYLEALK